LNIPADQRDLAKRMLSDYKEGKAYSYFDASWLKEINYHPIDNESLYCFLGSKSTPSQNINNIPHEVWVLLQKNSGKVEAAYCTCFAGYSIYLIYAWQLCMTNIYHVACMHDEKNPVTVSQQLNQSFLN